MQPLEDGEPTVIGPYRLLGRLGAGGMGRVYLGRNAGGRTVAVKVVHPHFALDEEFRSRFVREVEAARRVGGAWTAPVLDADPLAPVPWVATGYVAGPSLAQAVGERGALRALPEHSVRVLGAGLAEALAAVHALDLVHRDVKPSNVLLTLDGPRLIDFGIARATDGTASLTASGVSVGSPGYMAPEQILGRGAAPAADVFSLGAVLTYAATGSSPFRGDSSAALLYRVVHEEPELDGLTGDLRDIVTACLDKDADARPAPEALARRLAPEGAAALVASGWLPGPLVEQVSRTAVRLLDLEPGDSAGSSTGWGPGWGAPRSGPVPFSSPAVAGSQVQGGPATEASQASEASEAWEGAGGAGSSGVGSSGAGSSGVGSSGAGAFGPPDPSYGAGAAGAGSAAGVPQPRDESAAGGGPGPGRFSVSVAAGSTAAENGRGRRVSCTLALAVAGALAAVTVGAAFFSQMFPGGDSDNSADAGKQPPSAESSGPADPAPSQGAGKPQGVPASYIGTWEGKATANDGSIPMGTFRLTVRDTKPGGRVAMLRQTDIIGGTCDVVLKLDKVKSDRIEATGQGAKDSAAQCTKNSHTVHLRPDGDALVYDSENGQAGNPEARLSRVPGTD